MAAGVVALLMLRPVQTVEMEVLVEVRRQKHRGLLEPQEQAIRQALHHPKEVTAAQELMLRQTTVLVAAVEHPPSVQMELAQQAAMAALEQHQPFLVAA